MDAGFYRGTSTDQDIRFTDKERKLLKQMRFEQVLEQKVDLQKVNVDVLKPWITLKLNEILGMEDDVVVEYVFTQLEERELNPKKMQINLTGFLNAKRAREFMGELWQMFVEAQSSPEGIPASLVEKKVKELKIANAAKPAEQTYAKATEIDWQHRYKSLTGGRYGKMEAINYEAELRRKEEMAAMAARAERSEEERYSRRKDPDDDRDERAERRMRHEEQKFKERKDLLREKQRDEERESRRRNRKPPSSSSSSESSPLPVRRFVENVDGTSSSSRAAGSRKRGDDDEKEERKRSRDEEHKKKSGSSKKSRKRHASDEDDDSEDDGGKKKKSKKHHYKKDKKSKKHRDRD